jgi:hypothetical protein
LGAPDPVSGLNGGEFHGAAPSTIWISSGVRP